MKKVPQETWKLGIWGIVNPSGKPWTHHTFDTRAEAQTYLDAQAKLMPMWNLSRHKVKRVSVTVRVRVTLKS